MKQELTYKDFKVSEGYGKSSMNELEYEGLSIDIDFDYILRWKVDHWETHLEPEEGHWERAECVVTDIKAWKDGEAYVLTKDEWKGIAEWFEGQFESAYQE